jgi:glycosyltransferase 2 family protein
MSAPLPLEPRRPVVRPLRVAVAVTLTVAVLALLVLEVAEARPLLELAKTADPLWLAIAFAIALSGVLLSAERWRRVLAAMGHSVPLGRALHAVFACWPLSTVTPSRAGDFGRAWLVRDRVPLRAGASSVLAERAIDVHTLLLLGVACGALARLWLQASVLAALVIAEWITVYLIVRKRGALARLGPLQRFGSTIEQLGFGFDVLLARPLALLHVSLYSGAIRLLTVGSLQALLWSVGAHIPFIALVAPWLLATLAGMLPLTIAGMGTRDATFIALVATTSAAALSEPQLVFATIAYSLVALWSFALLGLPLLLRVGLAREARRTAA